MPRKQSLRLIFAAHLRREREASGLSQEALAHMAGVHRTFIGTVERGESNVSIDNIEKLSKAVGLRISFEGSSSHPARKNKNRSA
jgi:transcriptional regulator with XRE-family HTH domain